MKSFRVDRKHTSKEEFKLLVLGSFGLPASSPVCFHYGDLILPLCPFTIEHQTHYRLAILSFDGKCTPQGGMQDWRSLWKAFHTEDGTPYWHHTEAKVSVWERPIELLNDRERSIEEARKDGNQAALERLGVDPWENDAYFGSYSDISIHYEMLTDRIRVDKYAQAILQAKEKIEGQVVMDVGCGSGYLTVLAAKQGAKKVIAVEASEIVEVAKQVIEENGVSAQVEVYHKTLDHLRLPQPVDVIVSEWMGSLLIFESMIDAVIDARDRFLAPGGVLLPSSGTLFVAPIQATEWWEEHIGQWDDLNGVVLSPVEEYAREEFLSKPDHKGGISAEQLLATPQELVTFDMYEVIVEDLDKIEKHFDFVILRKGWFHGIAAWFAVYFDDAREVTLSTDPVEEDTHWKQDLFIMDEPIAVEKGMKVKVEVRMQRNLYWKRHYNIDVTVQAGEITKIKTFNRWRAKTSSPETTIEP